LTPPRTPVKCDSSANIQSSHGSSPLSSMSNGSPSSIQVKRRRRKLKKSQKKAMSLLGPEASFAVRNLIKGRTRGTGKY
jgi:hypothetical protein